MITFRQLQEKAVSKQQQKLMGLALAYKKGDVPEDKVSDTVKDLAKSMSTDELEKFAGTKHKGLPQKVDEAKSATGYDLYHKDFSSAMQHAYKHAKAKLGVDVDPEEIDKKVAMGPRKPSKGKTNSYRLLDKGGKKAIQVQVYGMDNGKYELNMYKESVDYGSRMTDAQKKKFHDLKKKMTGGPEYQKIMRKNQSPVKSDDEFHNLVLKKVMSEEMDPTKHVSKKGDMYCVYNKDGKEVAKFDDEEKANAYARKNHDKLMEAVAIDGRTKTFKETMKRLNARKQKLAEKEAAKKMGPVEIGTTELFKKYAQMTPGQTNEAWTSSYDTAASVAAVGVAKKGVDVVKKSVGKLAKKITSAKPKPASPKPTPVKPKPSSAPVQSKPSTPQNKAPIPKKTLAQSGLRKKQQTRAQAQMGSKKTPVRK